jgi:trans-2-enoyl-CoA reductase
MADPIVPKVLVDELREFAQKHHMLGQQIEQRYFFEKIRQAKTQDDLQEILDEVDAYVYTLPSPDGKGRPEEYKLFPYTVFVLRKALEKFGKEERKVATLYDGQPSTFSHRTMKDIRSRR